MIYIVLLIALILIFASLKKCPYCGGIRRVGVNTKYIYCEKCSNLLFLDKFSIHSMEWGLHKSINNSIIILFIIEYIKRNSIISENSRKEIYNFIVKNFLLTETQKLGLKRTCENTLRYGDPLEYENWKYLAFDEITLTDIRSLFIRLDDRDPSYNNFWTRNMSEDEKEKNKFKGSLSFGRICEEVKSGLLAEKKTLKNPSGEIATFDKYKLELFKQILKSLNFGKKQTTNLENIFVEECMDNFKMSFKALNTILESINNEEIQNKENKLDLSKCFELLKVNKNATKAEIENSYKNLIKTYNVEGLPLPDEVKQDFYKKRTKITEAYNLLMKELF